LRSRWSRQRRYASRGNAAANGSAPDNSSGFAALGAEEVCQ
jgi:hypothetical protein